MPQNLPDNESEGGTIKCYALLPDLHLMRLKSLLTLKVFT